MLDTASAPASATNPFYWDASFNMAWQVGLLPGVTLNCCYRDVIEMLYDGYESK